MFPHDPIFIAPSITQVPNYVYGQRYTRPINAGRWFSHPDAETALRAAKRACRGHPGRWFGRSPDSTGPIAFLVYEGTKVVERHVAGR